MIKNWILNRTERAILISNTALLWRPGSYFDTFEKMALESAAACGTDIRRFVNTTPYNPCWIAMKILIIKEQFLRNIVALGFYMPPTSTHSMAELPVIPDWMREAITSVAGDKPLGDTIDALIRIYPVDDSAPGYLRKLCPVCSMLRL